MFAPKYRGQIIYGKYKRNIGEILRELCERKGVEIIEANACRDHIHMLVSIPPKISVSSFIGYLKGKSSLMIFDRHANLKYRQMKSTPVNIHLRLVNFIKPLFVGIFVLR